MGSLPRHVRPASAPPLRRDRLGLGGAPLRRLGRALARADRYAFRWVARQHTPVLDPVLPRLSRAADRSVLWMAAAGVLFAAGGRFGRRAAVRGLGSLALTSAIVNLPAKLAARRARPAIDVVPQVRRLARIPLSSSFPSGHSASAAAFTTGVALELPRAAVPVAVLAAAVASSRVYTGVHYPGDVLAGAVLGVGIAAGASGLWPLPPQPGTTTDATTRTAADPMPDGAGLVVVANAQAGPALSPDPRAAIRRHLPGAELREVGQGDLDRALAGAASSADALGVVGGDGSVSAAAEAAAAAGVPLVVVPGGTLNHFAHDLGVTRVEDAAAAVLAGEQLAVDLARFDGRSFCNAVTVGSYARLIDTRDRLRDRIGEVPAIVVATVRALRAAEPVHLELDGYRRAVWLVFVGNCSYERHGIAPAGRRRLDDGVFDVRVVRADLRWARLRLVAALATGTVQRSAVYERWLVEQLHVRSLDGPLRATRDGETFDCPDEFTVTKAGEPITVYAPHHPDPGPGMLGNAKSAGADPARRRDDRRPDGR